MHKYQNKQAKILIRLGKRVLQIMDTATEPISKARKIANQNFMLTNTALLIVNLKR